MQQLQMAHDIMIKPGHLTKFCVLLPIKSKYPTEVASQLMDIFPLFCVFRQHFRATRALSLQPTASRKLKTFGLLWLWFVANPVIRKVKDLLNDQMVT